MFADLAKNNMLDAFGGTHLSLHSAYSADGLSNELTGGSPAYARKAVTYGAASGGTKASTGNVVFDVAAGSNVRWVGRWTGLAGSFLGMSPNGGGVGYAFAAEADDDFLTLSAPPSWSLDQKVVVLGDNLPTGLVAGTIYFVRDATGRVLKLAATAGGLAIDLTADGRGIIQPIVEESYGAQGTHTITTDTLDLNVLT